MPRLCSNKNHVKRYFDGRCMDCAAVDNRAAYAKRKSAKRTGLSPERAKISQDILDSLGHSDGIPSGPVVHSLRLSESDANPFVEYSGLSARPSLTNYMEGAE